MSLALLALMVAVAAVLLIGLTSTSLASVRGPSAITAFARADGRSKEGRAPDTTEEVVVKARVVCPETKDFTRVDLRFSPGGLQPTLEQL